MYHTHNQATRGSKPLPMLPSHEGSCAHVSVVCMIRRRSFNASTCEASIEKFHAAASRLARAASTAQGPLRLESPWPGRPSPDHRPLGTGGGRGGGPQLCEPAWSVSQRQQLQPATRGAVFWTLSLVICMGPPRFCSSPSLPTECAVCPPRIVLHRCPPMAAANREWPGNGTGTRV
jgi:hypothetical protein